MSLPFLWRSSDRFWDVVKTTKSIPCRSELWLLIQYETSEPQTKHKYTQKPSSHTPEINWARETSFNSIKKPDSWDVGLAFARSTHFHCQSYYLWNYESQIRSTDNILPSSTLVQFVNRSVERWSIKLCSVITTLYLAETQCGHHIRDIHSNILKLFRHRVYVATRLM